jgi:adenine/guanine phosphoribosyltransferase-like PRPP-binding protein
MSDAGLASAHADGERFLQPTTDCWQRLLEAGTQTCPQRPPLRWRYPVPLPDGRWLELPIRALASDRDRAVASLIPNQAAFPVVRALAEAMTQLARPLGAQVVVGPPTLGMALSPLVAEALGFERYVPLGYSRKFWYADSLAQDVRSLTTPGEGKKVYLDPNQVPRVARQRVVVVDDTVSNGTTLSAVARLLVSAGAQLCGVVVAMRQGTGWRSVAKALDVPVLGVFDTPRLRWGGDGWYPED